MARTLILAIQILQREGGKVLPLSEKVKVLHLIRKEKESMLRLLRSTVRRNLLSVKLWRRKKEIRASFAVSPLRNCESCGHGTSLVARWSRIRLPMQGTQVQALIQEDPTCRRATKPMCHNYWACVPQLLKPARLEPMLRNKRSHRSEE